MEDNHKLALYVAYYLSRFNIEAYVNLGYDTMYEAHEDIGRILAVNPHTIKNMRDQFDPLHGHRVGWYQDPLSPSRVRVVQALENLDEKQIREIVKDILSGKIQTDEEELDQLLNLVTTDDSKYEASKYILRGPTGKAAEECFLKHFKENKKPIDGNLIDCRDFGVGYDFKIETKDKIIFIEVKGLSDYSGGVLFTNKEWTVAIHEKDNYFLCIVSNLKGKSNIIFIQNPAGKLNAKRNLYTILQISWSVTQNQLNELND
jgi:hypothetical protein